MNMLPQVPKHINWPDGIDEQTFLTHYWQQKPLLIRQAFPAFDTPLPADELAGLSLEPETTPRLIIQDAQGAYHLEHGPFDEQRFAALTQNNWSLLVTDVEKHISELACYLQPFCFLPSWRIDDLMISYAPVGASVGAHIDEYDVFLLQASGKRRWSIHNDPKAQHALVPDAELKLIDSMQVTDSWELEPGDMLYLPPSVAHHGIASEEPCTTWSIGFRAPAVPDIVMRLAEMIAEKLPTDRFKDGPLTPAINGEMTDEAISEFLAIWQTATQQNNATIADLVGRLVTESGTTNPVDDDFSADGNISFSDIATCKAPFSRLAWHQNNSAASHHEVTLFANGRSYSCDRELAIKLCASLPVGGPANDELTASDQTLLQQLYSAGSIIEAEAELI